MIAKVLVPKKSCSLIPKSLLTNLKIFNKQLDLQLIPYEDYKDLRPLPAPLFSLESKGALISTEEFSSLLLDQTRTKTFLIGQKSGIPAVILNQSEKVLSLSKMTFPSWLAATILVEQIFRVLCITSNHPYARA